MPAMLITGGRDYRLTPLDAAVITAIHRGAVSPLHADLLARVERHLGFAVPRPTVLYEGGARGADTDARLIAERCGLAHVTFEANWATDGKAAGPIRNSAMLAGRHPDRGQLTPPSFVLAFPGGAGTGDMVAKAHTAGVPVLDLGGPHGDCLAPVQRWTRDDAWLVLSGGPEAIARARAERPGVGLPVISGHHLKARGQPTIPAWCEYVGRAAHGLRGHPLFANPFPVRPVGAHKPDRVVVLLHSLWTEMSHDEALVPFEAHLRRLARSASVRGALAQLHTDGKVLVCWCDHRKPCHACVVARAALMLAAQAANRQVWGPGAGSPHAEPDAQEQADLNRLPRGGRVEGPAA